MKYTTITNKGNELTAEWTGKCIKLMMWYNNDLHFMIEWAYTLPYAVHRFEWLIQHA